MHPSFLPSFLFSLTPLFLLSLLPSSLSHVSLSFPPSPWPSTSFRLSSYLPLSLSKFPSLPPTSHFVFSPPPWLSTSFRLSCLHLSLPSTRPPSPPPLPQILGGYLISGGQNGCVVLWSMGSQLPTVDSQVQAHSLSLGDIHVINSNHFLTVGNGSIANSKIPEDPATPTTAAAGGSSYVASQLSAGGGNGGGGGVALAGVASSTVGGSSSSSSSNGHASVEGVVVNQLARLSVVAEETAATPLGGGAPPAATPPLPSHEPATSCITLWQFDHPPRTVKTVFLIGDVISTAFHHQLNCGSMFLAVGMRDGTVKIYNVPTFSVASELHFSEMKGKDCLHVALNLSRESPVTSYYRHPLRDLILTTAWSDGKVMVCQYSWN